MTAVRALTLAAALAIPHAAAAESFVQGPYVQYPRTDAITVVWAQDVAGTGEVRVGAPGGALDTVVAAGEAALRHEVTVTGLSGGASYDYEVALADGTVSERGSFRTAAAPGTPFRWVLFGDTKANHTEHGAVVAAISAEPDLAFGVQTGDMVSSGEIAEEWDAYFDVELPLMRSVPIFPVIGNHDEHEGQADELVARFVAPDNSPMPEHYYSFTYGNAWFTVIDGHVAMLEIDGCLAERNLFMLECMTPEQVDWIEEDLANAVAADGIDHIFVLTHIGPYSSKENRSGSMQVRRLLPLFKEVGVTAVLSGHDHYYEHGVSAYGMHYVISGGAGASLYDISEPSSAPHEVLAGESVHHYVVVEVDGKTATFTGKRLDGSVIEAFSVTVAPECQTDADCEAVEPPPDCVLPAWCSAAQQCAWDCVVEGENPFPELGPQEPDADGAEQADASDAASEPAAEVDAGPEPEEEPVEDVSEAEEAEPAPPEPAPRSRGCGAGSGPVPLSAALLGLGLWLGLGLSRGSRRPPGTGSRA